MNAADPASGASTGGGWTAGDRRCMARALRLARHGLYTTDPNPRVGCVIAAGERVLGEGWHPRAGAPHAEPLALAAAGAAARGATAYVTLEPCCHHGRTPPCTDALIAAGVARVVCAMIDPNPLVAGQGIAALRQAGSRVEVGLLETEARALNPGFVRRMEQGRPEVRCKLAASLDGRTALANGESQWISSESARCDVQFQRARSSAILTGIGTVLADDPSLNVRLPASELNPAHANPTVRQPLRIVLDSHWRMPPGARLLGLPGATLVVGLAGDAAARHRRAALDAAGARILVAPESADTAARIDLAWLMRALAHQSLNEILVESGPTLAGALLSAGLADELLLYLAPHLMGDSARGLFRLPALAAMTERIPLEFVDIRRIGPDLRIQARPRPTTDH